MDGPFVQDFMTMAPQTIHATAPLEEAWALMEAHGIRHLPVCNDRGVVGIVSQRDLDTALGLDHRNTAGLIVTDVCHGHPYTVSPYTPLCEVAAEMADRSIGSALVMDGERLVGIFTSVDAFRLLAALSSPPRPCYVDEGE